MSRAIRLLAVALVATALSARAGTLRLVAPANAATLRGGSFAELHWSATQLPPSAEEWEAFLSIDGGKYYAFRITPHLEVDLQRFTFIVPNVDTRDARILIRVGDEVHETHFEIPGSFSIVRDPHAEQIVRGLLQFGRGESARDGDPGVLSWADGARNGSGVTQQSATTVPLPSLARLTIVASNAPAVLEPAASSIATPSIASAQRFVSRTYARNVESLARSVDLLLVCRRRNI